MSNLSQLHTLLEFHKIEIVPNWNSGMQRNGSKWLLATKWESNDKIHYVVRFGDFKRAIKESWNSCGSDYTEDEKKQFKVQLEKLSLTEQEEKIKMQFDVAAEVEKEWIQFADSGDHPYLQRKKISQLFGTKIKLQKDKGPILIIPMRDINGKLWSYQRIFAEKLSNGRDKLFRSGGRVDGLFHSLSKELLDPSRPIYLAEGFATAASIKLALGEAAQVVVTFSAQNMVAVAKQLIKTYQNAKYIVCADNDAFTEINNVKSNIGIEYGKRAAEILKGHLVWPVFKDNTKQPTDFNDLYVDEGVESVRAQLIEPQNKQYDRRNITELRFTSLKELFLKPAEEVEWIVEDLLVSSGTSLVSAKPKIGKTTLVRQLALAVAAGKSFLGRKTKQGSVLYLAVEEKESQVILHFKKMGATGDEPIFIHSYNAPHDALVQLYDIVTKMKPILVIVDTLFRVLRVADSNNYNEVTQALEKIQIIARDLGTHILCVHHANKGDREGGDSVLGSTAIFGGVDSLIQLKSEKSKRYIETQQRYGENLDKTELIFNEVTKATSLGSLKSKVTYENWEERIIVCLSKHSSPIEERIIEEECGGNKQERRAILRKLVAGGKVICQGKGIKGSPYLYSIGDTSENGSQERASLVC